MSDVDACSHTADKSTASNSFSDDDDNEELPDVRDIMAKLEASFLKSPLGDPRQPHEEYMTLMTTPQNPENAYLNQYWIPWAKECEYRGEHDFTALMRSAGMLELRQTLIERFSYAIPNQKALDKIASLSPVIEIGSGTGYWAHLLTHQGVDVIAVDDFQSHYNKPTWFEKTVLDDGVKYLREHDGCPDRTLFMSWPTGGEEVLKAFKGNTVILITEDSTWCMPDDNEDWKNSECVIIPTWAAMHDRLIVYRRVLKA